MKDIVKVFKALSDATRLRIVLVLAERDLCVCELVFILKMEQSRISHQLRILRDADLVEDVREGRWIIYRIPDAVRGTLRPFLEQLAGGKLAESRDVLRDLGELEVCLREDVRKKRGPAGVKRI
jgi:ArsR family transcriptional regulator, arsenate/arsenite/antimonite-responsive transcriptional repressor